MELKPCPFCGSEAIYLTFTRYYDREDTVCVFCNRCKSVVTVEWNEAEGINDRTKAKAVAAWNSRAERTCRNLAEPDEVNDRPFTCSECGASGPYGEGTYHIAKTETVSKELADALGIAEGSVIHSDAWPVWKYCPNCGAKVVD